LNRDTPPPTIAPIGGVDICILSVSLLLLVIVASVDVMVNNLPPWVVTDVNVLRVGEDVAKTTPNSAVCVAPLICPDALARLYIITQKLLTSEMEKTDVAEEELRSGINIIVSRARARKTLTMQVDYRRLETPSSHRPW